MLWPLRAAAALAVLWLALAPEFFFPCIAGLVRDLVGQQLEWACDWEQISPKKETTNQPNKTNNKNNTHKQAKARARQNSQGNLQTKWNQVKHTLSAPQMFSSTV